jgi:hypothetical protein
MRIFHVSEEEGIEVFEPRTPSREDLDPNHKLVWAVNENRLVNFLTPRNCPRVTFYEKNDSKKEDVDKYIGNDEVNSVIVIEQNWFKRMLESTLYIYEFETNNFVLQDEIAGYYVSSTTEVPISVTKIDDLFSALFNGNVELRFVPNLWPLFDDIRESSLGYSMCRMKFAQPRN